MNCLIFTEQEYQKVINQQEGLHQLNPIPLKDGTYFLTQDILTEINNGIFKHRLDEVTYSIKPYSDIETLTYKLELTFKDFPLPDEDMLFI
jgi:hypothetical protein